MTRGVWAGGSGNSDKWRESVGFVLVHELIAEVLCELDETWDLLSAVLVEREVGAKSDDGNANEVGVGNSGAIASVGGVISRMGGARADVSTTCLLE